MAMIAIMLTVCASLVRDPNNRMSRVFTLGLSKPLTSRQTTLLRAIGFIGIVIAIAVGAGLTIDMIDRGF